MIAAGPPSPELADAETPWRDLDPMDRAWSGVGYIRAFLDLDLPAAGRFRRALHDLAAETTAVGRWTTATRRAGVR